MPADLPRPVYQRTSISASNDGCCSCALGTRRAHRWPKAYLGVIARTASKCIAAGTEPADTVHPLAVRVMAEIGLDILHQRPKDLWHFVAEPWDFVITTCDRANEKCPTFPSARDGSHWTFKDPAATEGTDEERLQAFRRVRDEILMPVRLFVSVQARTGH